MDMWLSQFLESLFFLSPYFLLDLVVIVVALFRWQRHPRVSLVILLGVGLNVLVAVAGNFVLAWLPVYLFPSPTDYSWTVEDRRLLFRAIVMIRSVLGAMTSALLFVAVFMDRPRHRRFT